jgi:Raf kinase inhibitor-like YbhB/YbcL family protein
VRTIVEGDVMLVDRRRAIAGSLAFASSVSALPWLTHPASAASGTPVAQGAVACDPYAHLAQVPTFTVTSTDVREGEQMPKAHMSGKFGAGGQDSSPQLAWSGFPPETRSFVVTMFDPDAPTPSGFWHWAVADIPANVTELPTGAGSPDGAQLPAGAFHLPNDARLAQYIGAAPPKGDPPHRYYIVVTALDVDKTGIDKNATPALLFGSLASHVIGRATIVPISAPAS